MVQMKLKYPIQILGKAGDFDALAQTGTRNPHRFSGIGLLAVINQLSDRGARATEQPGQCGG